LTQSQSGHSSAGGTEKVPAPLVIELQSCNPQSSHCKCKYSA